MISIDQYRQRVGLFYAKSKIIYTRKIKLDFASFFLGIILLTILSIAPLYTHLFHFFYQQLLPNVDGLLVKTINIFASKLNKKPFLEPRLMPQSNPDILFLLSTPFITMSSDPIELIMRTLLFLICTPLLASWSLWTLRNSSRVIRYLPCPDKMDCLTILMIYYTPTVIGFYSTATWKGIRDPPCHTYTGMLTRYRLINLHAFLFYKHTRQCTIIISLQLLNRAFPAKYLMKRSTSQGTHLLGLT